ncbi:recombinase family protein [Nitratireductor sp. ac15]
MNNNSHHSEAVIYCRVSSTKQTTVGDGLASQETRCREFARMKGYEVIQVFKDDVSGSLINRPGMMEMLAFAKMRKGKDTVILIDDVSRLARDLQAHLELRGAIASVGARLESPSIEFGEDSELNPRRKSARQRVAASATEKRRANQKPNEGAHTKRLLGFPATGRLRVCACPWARKNAQARRAGCVRHSGSSRRLREWPL